MPKLPSPASSFSVPVSATPPRNSCDNGISSQARGALTLQFPATLSSVYWPTAPSGAYSPARSSSSAALGQLQKVKSSSPFWVNSSARKAWKSP